MVAPSPGIVLGASISGVTASTSDPIAVEMVGIPTGVRGSV